MNTKPSDIHNDESGELLRNKANEANRKRKERMEELKRQENIRQREEYRRFRKEEEKEQERARKEQERKEQERKEQERKEQERKTKSSGTNNGRFGKKIKTEVDGKEFDSLAKAMAWIDPVLWGKECDYRTSHWIKINRALKRDGEINYQGHIYRLI